MTIELPLKGALFTTGSIARHVLVMTMTGAVGMMALFMVDLISLYFLARLKQTAVTAAMGYASGVMFFALSTALGSGIAATALVARSIGAGDVKRARGYATSSLLFSLLSSVVLAIILILFSDDLLSLMNATGEARDLALAYIWIVSPGLILFGVALCLSAILRGLGDARRAMYVTLAMALVNVGLDPVLILGLDMGIQGAAVAAVVGYLAAVCIGLHSVVAIHGFLDTIRLASLRRDVLDIWTIAYPASLAQLSVPLGNAYVTYVIAWFGDEVVAGFAVISRLMPVVFGIALALAGAVGPIIGQNHGAGLHDRVRLALTQSLAMSTVYTIAMSLALFMLSDQIANVFHALGDAHDEIVFFCSFVSLSWAFIAAFFIANATFNNLGYPKLSAIFSWARVTAGTIPFVHVGVELGGWKGVLVGNALGAVVVAVLAVGVAYWIVSTHSVQSQNDLRESD
jgi:putative MATE family efflux protein